MDSIQTTLRDATQEQRAQTQAQLLEFELRQNACVNFHASTLYIQLQSSMVEIHHHYKIDEKTFQSPKRSYQLYCIYSFYPTSTIHGRDPPLQN